jgi:hypothetical protein
MHRVYLEKHRETFSGRDSLLEQEYQIAFVVLRSQTPCPTNWGLGVAVQMMTLKSPPLPIGLLHRSSLGIIHGSRSVALERAACALGRAERTMDHGSV